MLSIETTMDIYAEVNDSKKKESMENLAKKPEGFSIFNENR